MKKYSLKDLEVKSFVTKESGRVRGGKEASHHTHCFCDTEFESCNPTCGIRVDANGNPYC